LANSSKDTMMKEDRSKPGSGPDENEPKSINLGKRDFAGTSYAANEREQTDDAKGMNSAREADIADGGISEDLNDDGEL
jgi:hypothetical protein